MSNLFTHVENEFLNEYNDPLPSTSSSDESVNVLNRSLPTKSMESHKVKKIKPTKNSIEELHEDKNNDDIVVLDSDSDSNSEHDSLELMNDKILNKTIHSHKMKKNIETTNGKKCNTKYEEPYNKIKNHTIEVNLHKENSKLSVQASSTEKVGSSKMTKHLQQCNVNPVDIIHDDNNGISLDKIVYSKPSTSNSVENNSRKHPAQLPVIPYQKSHRTWGSIPFAPIVTVTQLSDPLAFELSWNLPMNNLNNIQSYHIYAYKEYSTKLPKTELWKQIADVCSLPLPMTCLLVKNKSDEIYHFAVQAMDIYSRVGPFSIPCSVT